MCVAGNHDHTHIERRDGDDHTARPAAGEVVCYTSSTPAPPCAEPRSQSATAIVAALNGEYEWRVGGHAIRAASLERGGAVDAACARGRTSGVGIH